MGTKIDVSSTSIQSALADFKRLGLIHICGWHKVPGEPVAPQAIYKRGKAEDAPRPKAEDMEGYVSRKERAKALREAQKEKSEVWRDLANRLVPTRTAQEMQQVNWAYLCYLSPDAVKYVE
jgi:hypothetical protein